ncbi:unnamed protein product [Macrosiphum euphorbiae]|uniref:TTF-type domain-containing protein n=1 Tax=Macrosiphum euphorbiae TaxID=13131 RepID=A0AAV0XYM4_9HEMI|nr:unnamed protein product [Macrosiphum euphorbiae]
MFGIFNIKKSKTSEDDTQKNISINTTSSSQQVITKSNLNVLINANDSDPDDPNSFNISQNNTDELNDTSNILNYYLKHSDTQANIVKDLGDLSTGPAQPILPAYPMTVFGRQNRSFNAKYYNEFKWIEYSIERNAVFCFCCRIFGCSSTDHVFTKSGFTNWIRLGTKFSKHSKLNAHAATQTHLINLAKMDGHNSSKITGNILCQVSNAHKDFVLKNRSYLKTLIDILLYLGRQGIAFRGNIENKDSLNRGNYLEACKLMCEHNPQFKQVFNGEINYTSPLLQNELIGICAENVRSMIVTEVKNAGSFSVMCDEARCHKQEQMSLCIRYANKFEVFERFLGFINVSESQNAVSLVTAMLLYLKVLKIDDIPIIAQSYDGANVMSGSKKGVQTLLREHYPDAIYIHCMAHRLNLVVIDMCKHVKYSKTVFNTLEAIYVHFSTPKKNKKLQDVQKKLKMNKLTLSAISDTRWVCRHKNCKAVIESFSSIVEVLEHEVEEDNDGDVSRAIGILATIQKTEFVVNLHVMHFALGIINVLSNKLQNKMETLGHAANLKRKRKEPDLLRDYCLSTTTGAEDNLNLIETAKDYWMSHAYFPVIDAIINDMKTRFSVESLKMAKSIDTFLDLQYDKDSYFVNHYKILLKIEEDDLKCELKVAKKVYENQKVNNSKKHNEQLKSVISYDTYPNIYKLMHVALAIPISSATCERSFSSMRRINTYLRSNMEQDRFTDLSIINIERELSNQIDNEQILNKFSEKERRMQL